MGAFKQSKPRTVASRPLRKRILIVCEGEKTETHYFKDFKIPSVSVIHGHGCNNKALIEFAVTEMKKASVRFDDVWCVFDRDDFPKDKLNDAITKAESAGIRIAASNECFELWYLLHFDFVSDQQTRKEYGTRLKAYLKPMGIEYNKQSLYQCLLDKLPIAIKNAKKLVEHHSLSKTNNTHTLLKCYPNLKFADTKPFTTVQDLVEDLITELNKIGPPRE